jgi:TRAP transporter TAXI family solute receptor
MTLSAGPSGLAIEAMLQGVAATVNENSDSINVGVRPMSGSSRQSMESLGGGSVDTGFTTIQRANELKKKQGPYSNSSIDLDSIRQFWHLYTVQSNWSMKSSSEIQTVNDFTADNQKISMGIKGSAFRDYLEAALSHAVDVEDINASEVGFTQQGTQLDQGNIDALIEVRQNTSLSSWVKQINQVVPNRKLVRWPEDIAKAVDDDPALAGSYYTPEEMTPSGVEPVGWEGADELFWLDIEYVVFTTTDLDPEVAYEFLNTLYNNQEQLAEYHPVLKDVYAGTDFEFLNQTEIDFFPFHEGAKRFYDEIAEN